MGFNKIVILFAEILGVEEEDLSMDTQFTKEYGIEPVDVAKLIIAAEREFNITVHDEDAAFFKNIGDIVSYINGIIESY